jgi:hypothetical protein
MSNVANARINTFGQSPKADIVSPSEEEPVFILTSSQLSNLITQAVEKAIQPLQDEVSQLRATVATQGEKIAALEATEEQDVNRICMDIAQDRRRLTAMESRTSAPAPSAPPQGERTIARIGKIEEVLKSRGPTTLKQLGHVLGICKATMTRLLGKLDMRRYELHARPGDAREKVLRLKAQIR